MLQMSVSWLIKSNSKLKRNRYWRITYTWFWFYHIHQLASRGNWWKWTSHEVINAPSFKSIFDFFMKCWSFQDDDFTTCEYTYVLVLVPNDNFPDTTWNRSDGNNNPTPLNPCLPKSLTHCAQVLRYEHLESRQSQQEAYISQVYYPI